MSGEGVMDDQKLAKIVERCQKGDASAFEWIVRDFGPRIFSFLLRMVRHRELAEDLTQDTFVRALSSINRYDHRDRLSSWLFRIAMNLVRDHVRKIQRRGPTISGDSVDGEQGAVLAILPAETAAADERLSGAEDRRLLHAAMAELTPEYREVIVLRHYSGLSFKEIAAILDCPLGTALARMHRGLAKLRQLMGVEKGTSSGGEV